MLNCIFCCFFVWKATRVRKKPLRAFLTRPSVKTAQRGPCPAQSSVLSCEGGASVPAPTCSCLSSSFCILAPLSPAQALTQTQAAPLTHSQKGKHFSGCIGRASVLLRRHCPGHARSLSARAIQGVSGAGLLCLPSVQAQNSQG